MNCGRATELLALHAGGDLQESEVEKVYAHMHHCADCRLFYERLVENQSLLKSLRPETVTPAALTEMRRGLFSQLEDVRIQLGWRVRLERFLLLGFGRPRFAVAGALLVAIISATLFAQLHQVAAKPGNTVVMLDGSGTLQLPEGYREWVLVNTSTEPAHPGISATEQARSVQKVFMNPDAYREYRSTGAFPEGTVMVLESDMTLVSVKDQRFAGGWAYFRFDDGNGRLVSKAGALPESAGCVACHRNHAAKDRVFTQFYPVLRSAAGVL
jgi:hypothetical protein